jgi:hypothetical protein
MGSTGTVPFLVAVRKRDQIFHELAEGRACGLGRFWKLQSLNCGEAA